MDAMDELDVSPVQGLFPVCVSRACRSSAHPSCRAHCDLCMAFGLVGSYAVQLRQAVYPEFHVYKQVEWFSSRMTISS